MVCVRYEGGGEVFQAQLPPGEVFLPDHGGLDGHLGEAYGHALGDQEVEQHSVRDGSAPGSSSTPTTLSGTTSTIHAAGFPSISSMRETFTSGLPSGISSAAASSASPDRLDVQVPAVQAQPHPLGVDGVGLEPLEP